MVSTLSIVFMGISCAVGFLIPIVLFVYFRRKKQADILPFFVGCAILILFALVLEQFAHGIILSSPLGNSIIGNIWLYGLYGGLMAGLFEETGRYIAFRFLLKKDKPVNALMYGAGHGGIEAAIVLGTSMINNLSYSLTLNTGGKEALLEKIPEELVPQVESAFDLLVSTPSYQFLLGSVERVIAVILQISLSVIVWSAAKRGRTVRYLLAILIHMIVDAAAAILLNMGVSVIIIEIIVAAATALTVLYAVKIWNEIKEPEANESGAI